MSQYRRAVGSFRRRSCSDEGEAARTLFSASLRFTLFSMLAVLLANCSGSNAPLHPQTAISSGVLGERQASYDVKHYRLELQVYPARKFLEGAVEMQAVALDSLSVIELDLDPRFEVLTASINNESAQFRTQGGKLMLSGAVVASGSEFETRVSYRGRPYEAENPPWDGGFVWAHTESGEHWIATAVQGRGCDLYWPCKDHISDKPERGADMLITVPSELTAVMNGVLVSQSNNEGRTTYHWSTKNPISAYHLAVNIGPFRQYELQHYNALSSKPIPVIFYHISDDMEKIERLIKQDFMSQLEFFERTLGPYPWGEEKIGIVEIPYLGMEHQTMNGYGNDFKLDPYGFDWLMQHEFSHEWFGNLMTQTESADFWLHEGFANYMQPVYAQQVIGDAGYWSYMWDFYNGLTNCKAVVPDEDVTMDYFESNDAYYKGSWTLHTLRGLMGEETFWRSVRRLIYDTEDPWSLSYPIQPTRRSNGDFVAIASEEYGQDLSWLFDMYLGQAALPKLIQDRSDEGVSFSWADNSAVEIDIPILVTLDGNSTEYAVPSTGERFPLPPAALLQVDPRVSVFRDFGTTEACVNN
ncbi:MAG: M1 family metallopeptidase [Pseudomonadales bacterium]|nr:M1 family metallopeptidase [Pseudomonadales bacterium]